MPQVELALSTIQTMQVSSGAEASPPYTFQRLTTAALDTTILYGRGPPAAPHGLSRSLFRPSDDAVALPYNIPGNAMACVETTHLIELLTSLSSSSPTPSAQVTSLIELATDISQSICAALQAEVDAASASKGLPFEVDGFDNSYFMDDANIPSLLSLPFVGYMQRNNSVYEVR